MMYYSNYICLASRELNNNILAASSKQPIDGSLPLLDCNVGNESFFNKELIDVVQWLLIESDMGNRSPQA